MVYAGQEEEVDGLFDFFQGGFEMVFEPCGRLRRGQFFTGDVGHRGGCFDLDDVFAFCFGDVGGGVQVEDVCWGAVGLVADDVAALLGPVVPALSIVFEDQVGEGFSVVGEDSGVDVGGVAAQEGWQVMAEVVSAAFLEFVEEVGSEVGFSAGVVDLIGIVKPGAKA